MKLLVNSLLLTCNSFFTQAQAAKIRMFKLHLNTLPVKVVSWSYEHQKGKRISLQANVFAMPKRGLPLHNTISSLISLADTNGSYFFFLLFGRALL